MSAGQPWHDGGALHEPPDEARLLSREQTVRLLLRAGYSPSSLSAVMSRLPSAQWPQVEGDGVRIDADVIAKLPADKARRVLKSYEMRLIEEEAMAAGALFGHGRWMNSEESDDMDLRRAFKEAPTVAAPDGVRVGDRVWLRENVERVIAAKIKRANRLESVATSLGGAEFRVRVVAAPDGGWSFIVADEHGAERGHSSAEGLAARIGAAVSALARRRCEQARS